MERPPFFIVGSPRSGTTILQETLNQHPRIVITNETRIMSYVNKILRHVAQTDRWMLGQNGDGWLAYLTASIGDVIYRYYKEVYGVVDGMWWGDKHPHYADPRDYNVTTLHTILNVFPKVKIIHIVRDPRSVVASLAGLKWHDYREGIALWKGSVQHAEQFLERLPEDQRLTVRHEDFCENPEAVTAKCLDLLGVTDNDFPWGFFEEDVNQRVSPEGRRAAFTGPESWEHLPGAQVEKVVSECRHLMRGLGYE